MGFNAIFTVPTLQIKHLIRTRLDCINYSLPHSKQQRKIKLPKLELKRLFLSITFS
ncbi:hypothetical protein KFK09_017445 [Dendrobium nobile]|uniref:Uncharacterized protein n=1 Tax=Dendrobium nobile TaxID=94219 RepID=A0A8T3B3F7_DENNO|nr:hypothetical protein KFK09_017445 [Dendrobium nobile]